MLGVLYMRLGIAGGGAVGLLFASYLQESGHKVHVWTKRESQAQQLDAFGVKRGGETFPVSASVFPGREPVDAVIAAVKQYDVPELLEKGLPEGVPVLFVQNGMSHLEIVKSSREDPLFAVVTHGAMRVSDVEVVHTGIGKTLFGGKNKTNILTHTLQGLGDPFKCEWTENIEYELKRKLIVNAVINPLTVLYEDKNAVLLSNKEAFYEARRLFTEAAEVLELPLSTWGYVEELLEQTRNNRSSMLVDYLEKRPLEIDAINGYIVKEGSRKNIGTPAHLDIIARVNAKVDLSF
jgi:2-dehydropantoate 2-reductase